MPMFINVYAYEHDFITFLLSLFKNFETFSYWHAKIYVLLNKFYNMILIL